MRALVKTETTYKLKLDLNEEEAIELMGYVQNYHGDPEQESSALARVRAHIFEALRKNIVV